MRLFTLFAGSQRILTINSDDVQEAREALTTLLGSTDGMVVRAASVNECLAWNSSAMTATREQRTEAPPASTPAGLPLVQATKKPRRAVTASGASEGARPKVPPEALQRA
jgi:hypothetical protein